TASYCCLSRGIYRSLVSGIDDLSRLLGESHLAAIRQSLKPDARRPICLGIDDRDVRNIDGRLFRDDAALAGCRLARVALNEIDPAHDRAVVFRNDPDDFTLLAFIAAGNDHHAVALFDLELVAHQITSGASETIFMRFFARSSRVTGPKMRVPIGSIFALTR